MEAPQGVLGEEHLKWRSGGSIKPWEGRRGNAWLAPAGLRRLGAPRGRGTDLSWEPTAKSPELRLENDLPAFRENEDKTVPTSQGGNERCLHIRVSWFPLLINKVEDFPILRENSGKKLTVLCFSPTVVFAGVEVVLF